MARATPGPSFAEQIVEALKQKSRPEPHSGKLATAKRKRLGETVGEQCLKMVEQAGMSIEQVAKKDGYREDVIERSLLRARKWFNGFLTERGKKGHWNYSTAGSSCWRKQGILH
jgi:hypothetical protein